MNWTEYRFSKNKSSSKDILLHLSRCDHLFTPKLSHYVNLQEYSDKLFRKSYRYEIYDNSKLIGLIAVYFNVKEVFISNFSIEEKLIGQGYSKNLFYLSLKDFALKDYETIRLEVFKLNHRAIHFYKRLGFDTISDKNDTLTLIKNIEDS